MHVCLKVVRDQQLDVYALIARFVPLISDSAELLAASGEIAVHPRETPASLN
jgi:hypothetical protein